MLSGVRARVLSKARVRVRAYRATDLLAATGDPSCGMCDLVVDTAKHDTRIRTTIEFQVMTSG